MSTRCQVQVIEENEVMNRTFRLTLYHHTDGYPDYIIPMFYKAYCYPHRELKRNKLLSRRDAKTQAGKVASLLCWADPTIFEPEDHHNFHSDIEYYYRLYCMSSADDKGFDWEIEIYERDLHKGLDKDWDLSKKIEFIENIIKQEPSEITIDDLTLIQERIPIEKLIMKYVANIPIS